jgi:hypothetical protein
VQRHGLVLALAMVAVAVAVLNGVWRPVFAALLTVVNLDVRTPPNGVLGTLDCCAAARFSHRRSPWFSG